MGGDTTPNRAVVQGAGLIRYNRGHIEVLDRPGLKKAVCECYTVVKLEFDRLIEDIPRSDPCHVLGQSNSETRSARFAASTAR